MVAPCTTPNANNYCSMGMARRDARLYASRASLIPFPQDPGNSATDRHHRDTRTPATLSCIFATLPHLIHVVSLKKVHRDLPCALFVCGAMWHVRCVCSFREEGEQCTTRKEHRQIFDRGRGVEPSGIHFFIGSKKKRFSLVRLDRWQRRVPTGCKTVAAYLQPNPDTTVFVFLFFRRPSEPQQN